MPFPTTVDSLADDTTVIHASQVLGVQRITVGPTQLNLLSDQFGTADPTGTVDSTTAINNWLAACPGKLGIIPPGTYLMSQAFTALANSRIAGTGRGQTTIKQAGASAGTNLCYINVAGVSISDLTFDGNSAVSTSGHGVGIDLNTTDVDVQRINVQNAGRSSGTWAGFFIAGGALRGVIRDCNALSVGNGNNATAYGFSNNGSYFLVDHCRATGVLPSGNQGHGFGIQGDHNSAKSCVADTINNGNGFLVSGGNDHTLEDCVSFRTGWIGSTPTNIQSAIAVYNAVRVKLTDCLAQASAGDGFEVGVSITGFTVSDVLLENCVGVDNGAKAAGFQYGFLVTGSGTDATSTIQDVSIMNCHAMDTRAGASRTQQVGFQVTQNLSTLNRISCLYHANNNSTSAFGLSGTVNFTYIIESSTGSNVTIGNQLRPSNFGTIQTTNSLWMGSGAPSNTNGSNGDFYFRLDTPGTANQRLYIKSAGAWVALVL